MGTSRLMVRRKVRTSLLRWLVYTPDWLVRRYAYQALLIKELARAGCEVRFVKAPTGDTPKDRLLVQFQGHDRGV